jgi:transposase
MLKKSTRFITEIERREIIEEYLTGNESRIVVWKRHTGQAKERGQLLRWMRQLGYLDKSEKENVIPLIAMSKKSKKSKAELEKRVKELEDQLLDSQLKEEGYRRMIEIAEKDLKISIRKKPNTK